MYIFFDILHNQLRPPEDLSIHQLPTILTTLFWVAKTMVRKYPPNPRGTENVFSDIRVLSIEIYVLSFSCLAMGINLVQYKRPRE